MRLSISSWCYHNLGQEEAFRNIAGFGVEGIEIVTHPPASHVNENSTREQIDHVKKLLKDLELTICAISPATEFLQFDQEHMEAEIQHVYKVLDLCIRLGVDHVRIFAGGKIPQDRTLKDCIDAVVYGLKRSAQYAQAKGIKLSVENHGQFGRTFDLFKEVMDAVPEVGVTLHTSGIERMTDDYLGMVEYFAPRIVHTHLNDGVRVGEIFEARALGQGVLDFPAIFNILEDAGYSGYYNLEYGPSSFNGDPTNIIQASLAYLRANVS